MIIKSILVWPKEVCCSSEPDNSSQDTHHSEYAAKCVCEDLICEGLGCMRQTYPLEARVEVDGVVKFKWSKDAGYTMDVTEPNKPSRERWAGFFN